MRLFQNCGLTASYLAHLNRLAVKAAGDRAPPDRGFFNLDPVRFLSTFVRRLPGCVRTTLCWRAASSGRSDLAAYGAVLDIFPSNFGFVAPQGAVINENP
jgi:hypothetical protein